MKQYIEVLDTKVYGKTAIGILLFLEEQIRDRPLLQNHGFGDREIAYYNSKEVSNGTTIYTPTMETEENRIDTNSIFTVYGSYGRRFINKNPQWFRSVDTSIRGGYRFYLNSKLYEFLQTSKLEIKN